ncbi:MAG TPA: NAD(P)-dependent oxidoreductase [Acidimicrobiales bacterium]|nr:NAD(P)-dependent oxidoreductase [Acidimicrobiales bacterium]
MKVLTVTGASGYLGGRVVDYASRHPDLRVRSVVRGPSPWLAGETVHIESLEVDGDRAVSGSDFVIHLAGANEVAASSDPDASLRDTVAVARAVAEGCSRSGVSRLVYVSTVHVYGQALQAGELVDEETIPQPRSPYAIARLAAEHSIQTYSGTTQVVILRLTNSVGAPAHPAVDRWSLVGNDLCRQVACGGPITLKSSGQQWRDFVAMRDVVEILTVASLEETIAPSTYNLGAGVPTTIRQFANLVAEVADRNGLGHPDVVAPAPEPNPPAPYRISVGRLSAYGCTAKTPLDDAIAETLLFCARHSEQLCEDRESIAPG